MCLCSMFRSECGRALWAGKISPTIVYATHVPFQMLLPLEQCCTLGTLIRSFTRMDTTVIREITLIIGTILTLFTFVIESSPPYFHLLIHTSSNLALPLFPLPTTNIV